MKKILIITYYWPPSGGAGVQRWLKFSKYLPEYGWEPVILTVDPEYAAYPQRDESLVNEIDDNINVFHTPAKNISYSFYKIITGKKEIPYGGFANEINPGLIQKTLRFFRGNFVLPDARKGWNKPALKEALRIIKEYNIGTIITTSPPHSTQLIGRKLKKMLDIKWIADLRDPWSDIYYSGQMFQTLPARAINRYFESSVLENADLIITTCNATKTAFGRKLKNPDVQNKIVSITNGYDDDDLPGPGIVPDSFVITYLGTISGSYNLSPLLNALKLVKYENDQPVGIRFIGQSNGDILKEFNAIEGIKVEIIPYQKHKTVLEFLAKSVVQLLIVPEVSTTGEMIPGKLFEYIASGRTVVSIGPAESDVSKIISETNCGRNFTNEDYQQLGNYISELLTKFRKGEYMTHTVGSEKYSRRNLTRTLAANMDDLI